MVGEHIENILVCEKHLNPHSSGRIIKTILRKIPLAKQLFGKFDLLWKEVDCIETQLAEYYNEMLMQHVAMGDAR
jgi:hypothetical protein